MGEMKHTPGPYSLLRSPSPVDGQFDYAISAIGSPVLAEAFGRAANGLVLPAEANARLIAAAPDLLECLEHAVHWHDQLSLADIARFKAALARAKATSP